MALTRLQFQPGIVRDQTAYSSEGTWFDGNLVRFRLGYPETIGGWVRASDDTFEGVCRSLHPWVALDGSRFLGVGTSDKFYIEAGQQYFDITPIRRTETLDNPFEATDGSDLIDVTDPGHGAGAGDYVTFSGADGLGGNVTADELNKEFSIVEVLDGDTYTIQVGVTASSADTGGGGSTVEAEYQVNVGLNTQIGGTGWGAGSWGDGGWGDPADTPVEALLRIWSQDNFGEDLIYGFRGGPIFYWDKTDGLSARGEPLDALSADTTTPTVATQVLVSDQARHVIALGANQGGSTLPDPMLIRFSSEEAPDIWTPTANNSAGDLVLSSGSRIVRGIKTKREILIWTDAALYSMQYLGPPFTFGVQQVSSLVTVAGFNAMAAVEDNVFWMGRDVFYVYSGQTQELPCPVKDFVFRNFNREQSEKVFAGVNSEYSEVTWFYPSAESEENDRYVTFNYRDNVWYFGQLDRTAWLDRSIRELPVAAGTCCRLFDHEIGTDDGSQDPALPLNAFIESAPLDIGDGDNFMFIRRVLPDVTFSNATNAPRLTMELIGQNFPGSPRGPVSEIPTRRSQAIPVEEFTEEVHVRMRVRSIRLRVESNRVGTRWILGAPRIDVQPAGRR